jgi:hypothetical protein
MHTHTPVSIIFTPHAQVSKHLAKLRDDKMLNAFVDGQLLDSEVTRAVRDGAATMITYRDANDHLKKLAGDRIGRRLSPVTCVPKPLRMCLATCVVLTVVHEFIRCLGLVQVTIRDVAVKKLFFDPALIGIDAAKAAARLRQLGATQADSRLTADVIVVPDPANLCNRTGWIAALLGLTIASRRLFWTGHGPAVKYTAAIESPLRLLLTDRFQSTCKVHASILNACVSKPNSRWVLVRTAGVLRKGVVLTIDRLDNGRNEFGPTRFLGRHSVLASAGMGVCKL